MRKLFLSLLVVAGLTVACEQEQISDLHFDLSNTNIRVANLEREVEELRGLVSSEIAGVLRLVSELDFSTQEQFAQITADLSSSVDALAAADAANLALLLQEVADTEQRLLDLIVDNAEALQAQISAQNGVNADLEAALSDAYSSLSVAILNLQNTSDGNLQTEIDQIKVAIDSANTALQLQIDAINTRITETLTRTRELISGLRTDVDWNAEARERLATWVGNLQRILIGANGYNDDRRTGIAGQLDDLIATVAALPEGTDVSAQILTAIEGLDVNDIDGLQGELTRLAGLISANDMAIAALTTRVNTLSDAVDAIDFIDTTELQTAIDNVLAAAQAYADNNDDDTVFDPAGLQAQLDALDTVVADIANLQTQINAIDFVDTDELSTAIEAAIVRANNYADANDDDTVFDATGLQTQLDALSTVVADIANLQAQIDALPDSYIGQEDIDEAVAGLQRQINTLSIENQGDAATLASLQGQINALQAALDALDAQVNPVDPSAWTATDLELLGASQFTDNGGGTWVNDHVLIYKDDNGRYQVDSDDDSFSREVFDDLASAIAFADARVQDAIDAREAAQLATDRREAIDNDIAGLTLRDGFVLSRSGGDGLQIDGPFDAAFGYNFQVFIDVTWPGGDASPRYRHAYRGGDGNIRYQTTDSLQDAYDQSLTVYTAPAPAHEDATGAYDGSRLTLSGLDTASNAYTVNFSGIGDGVIGIGGNPWINISLPVGDTTVTVYLRNADGTNGDVVGMFTVTVANTFTAESGEVVTLAAGDSLVYNSGPNTYTATIGGVNHDIYVESSGYSAIIAGAPQMFDTLQEAVDAL